MGKSVTDLLLPAALGLTGAGALGAFGAGAGGSALSGALGSGFSPSLIAGMGGAPFTAAAGFPYAAGALGSGFGSANSFGLGSTGLGITAEQAIPLSMGFTGQSALSGLGDLAPLAYMQMMRSPEEEQLQNQPPLLPPVPMRSPYVESNLAGAAGGSIPIRFPQLTPTRYRI